VIGVHESITEFSATPSTASATPLPDVDQERHSGDQIGNRLSDSSPRCARITDDHFLGKSGGPLRSVDPRYSTEQPWEHLQRDGYHVGAKFSRNLFGSWRAVATYGYESESVLNKSCTLNDPNAITGEGAYACGTFGFAAYTNRTYRLDVLGSFDTFGIRHDVTLGASQLKQQYPPANIVRQLCKCPL